MEEKKKREDLLKKVRKLCEENDVEFFFAIPGESEWSISACEHLRKIVTYHTILESEE